MTIQPTDQFIVNRGDSTKRVPQSRLMEALQDTDLLLVNRDSQTFKITGAEFKTSVDAGGTSGIPVLTSATVAQTDVLESRFTNASFKTTYVNTGGTPMQLGLQAQVDGNLTLIAATAKLVGWNGVDTLEFENDSNLDERIFSTGDVIKLDLARIPYTDEISSFTALGNTVQADFASNLNLGCFAVNDAVYIGGASGTVSEVKLEDAQMTVALDDASGVAEGQKFFGDQQQGSATIAGINGSSVTVGNVTNVCFTTDPVSYCIHSSPKTITKAPTSDPLIDDINQYVLKLAGDKNLREFRAGDSVYASDEYGVKLDATYATAPIVSFEEIPNYPRTQLCATGDQTVDLSRMTGSKQIAFLTVEGGGDSGGGRSARFEYPRGAHGGTSGNAGRAYQRLMTKDEYTSVYGTDQHSMIGANNFGGVENVYTPGTGTTDDNGWGGGTGIKGDDATLIDLNLSNKFVGLNFAAGGGGKAGGGGGCGECGRGGNGGGGGLLVEHDEAHERTIVLPNDFGPLNAYRNIPAEGGDGGGTGPCSRSAGGGYGGKGWGAGAGSGAGGSEGGGCNGAGGTGAVGGPGIDMVFFSTPVYKVTLENNNNFRWFEPGDLLADGTTILEVDRDNNQLIVYNQVDPTPGEAYTSLVYSGTGIVSSIDLAQRTITLSESNNHWGIGSHVTGVDRTAAASSAWLSFDLNGENMQLTNSKPAPMLMANTVDPTITFPQLFSNGETPDYMIPDGSTLKTTVTAINNNGQSVVLSQSLAPFATGSTREAEREIPEIEQILWNEEGLLFVARAGAADFRNAAAQVNQGMNDIDGHCEGCTTNQALLDAEEAIK